MHFYRIIPTFCINSHSNEKCRHVEFQRNAANFTSILYRNEEQPHWRRLTYSYTAQTYIPLAYTHIVIPSEFFWFFKLSFFFVRPMHFHFNFVQIHFRMQSIWLNLVNVSVLCWLVRDAFFGVNSGPRSASRLGSECEQTNEIWKCGNARIPIRRKMLTNIRIQQFNRTHWICGFAANDYDLASPNLNHFHIELVSGK